MLVALILAACDGGSSRTAASGDVAVSAASDGAAPTEERMQFADVPPPAAPSVPQPEPFRALRGTAEMSVGAALGGRSPGTSGEASAIPEFGPTQLPAGAGQTVPEPLVVRTGAATLQVDSLETGLDALQRVVQSIAGAYVANTSLESGAQQTRRATLVVKVPAAQFDRLVAGLSPIGRVESVNVDAEDVTEEFVDVTARVENARRLESRLVDLLVRRTGKLDEVLAVETQLARVREEIERYAGRLRYLRTRATLSTLSVSLHEPRPVLGVRPGTNPLAEAFREAWRNFVGFVAGAIALLGVLVPLAVLAYGAWLLVRRLRRPPRAGASTV